MGSFLRKGPPKTQNKPKKRFRINKSAQKRTQNEPKRTQSWRASVGGNPSESVPLRAASKNERKTNPTVLSDDGAIHYHVIVSSSDRVIE
jgi:hypothetical protein